ncbi:uncharacterized protein DEA37_0010678 [Paragonimus westermani]|uniref:Uncharacterized protein n=1 Tax=Paragonimus westermani TaxID=34504 RepID=A0A5J4P3A7_9TREM|nr:uncharacterized protein DEA37_0010678 [Paragonimus westermani]
MEWALSWFEKISIELSSTRKRRGDIKKIGCIRRKNIRHTPSTTVSSARFRPNKDSGSSKSPMFIMNGNWAPSPQVLHDNMMKAHVVKSREMSDFFRLLCRFYHLTFGCSDEDAVLKKFLEYDSCYKCADNLMSIFPDHPIWTRERPRYHGKVIRAYAKEENSNVPRGPEQSPPYCVACQPISENRADTDLIVSLPITASGQITRERSSNDSAFGSYFEDVVGDFEDFIEPSATSQSPCEETWLSQETYHSS